jgi:uncharacterized protein YdaT
MKKSDSKITNKKVEGYQKAADNMMGSKVNAMVNEGYQPRKAISISNIKKK